MWAYTLSLALLMGRAHSVPYSEYILAPSSRTVFPVAVHQVNGTVTNAEGILNGANTSATFAALSAVTYDFGKNIAGQVSVVAGDSVFSPDAVIGLTYTESSFWIANYGCDATANSGVDEPL